MSWIRVTKKEPCPICAKDNWCMVSDEGDSAMCMRVQSSKPLTLKSGELSYIHKIGDKVDKRFLPKKKEDPKPTINAKKLMEEAAKRTIEADIAELSKLLGVTDGSLGAIGVAWFSFYQAWGFQMKDGYGNKVGIRLRNDKGEKWAVKGSKQGLFYSDEKPPNQIVVCEGPTDTAAAISCGFFAVGRPS